MAPSTLYSVPMTLELRIRLPGYQSKWMLHINEIIQEHGASLSTPSPMFLLPQQTDCQVNSPAECIGPAPSKLRNQPGKHAQESYHMLWSSPALGAWGCYYYQVSPFRLQSLPGTLFPVSGFWIQDADVYFMLTPPHSPSPANILECLLPGLCLLRSLVPSCIRSVFWLVSSQISEY